MASGKAVSACLDEDAILRVAMGAVTEDDLCQARAHLDACPDCRSLAEHVARTGPETRDGLVARAILDEHMGELPHGTVGDRFELGELIGAGGMGFVMSAVDLTTGARVAVKFMRREAAGDPGAVARFEREARAMAALRSRYTARVWHVGTAGDLPYFVMEYLEGIPLAALVGKCGRIAWRDATRYAIDACAALVQAHAAGIIHRDIKPQNLFLCTDGVRVLDFGVAKSIGSAEGLTATARLLGTPQYMAPEQIRDARAADARTDIWALGATLYRLLSGQHAFPGANAGVVCGEILHGKPEPLRSKCPDCPPALEAVVMRCLSKDPAARFVSAAELLAELEGVLRAAPAKRSWARPLALVAALFVLVAGAAIVRARSRGAEAPSAAAVTPAIAEPSTQPAPPPPTEPVAPAPPPTSVSRAAGVAPKRSASKPPPAIANKAKPSGMYDRF